MSRATADLMRRALQFCHRGVSLKCLSAPPAAASSKLFCISYQLLPTPRTAFYFPFRHFSDAPTHSTLEECENQSIEPTVTSTSRPKSVFMDRLDLCRSPSDVLDLTCQFAPTHLQLSNCLTHMWNTLKTLREEQRRVEQRLMWEHAGWEPLLQRALGAVTHLPDSSLAYALLALVKLGVGPRTRVVQTYLRAAQERINSFDDKCLSILSSCLENMEAGPNTRALKDGIRLRVEAHLPRIKDVLHLQTMMRLVGKDAPLKLKHKLMSKALSLSDQFSVPNAQHMISSMAALGLSSKLLLSVCCNKITEHLSEMPFNPLLKVLLSCGELKFRDLQLLTAVSEYGATMVPVWSHRQLILVLASLEALSFSPVALLDSYSDLVQSDPGALTLKDLLCVLRVCCSLNYNSPSLVSCLSSALEQYLPRMTPEQLLNATHRLTVMGHFPPTLLQALLQEATLQQLRQKEATFVQTQLDLVGLCVRLERPELHQALPVLPSTPSPAPPPHHSSRPEFSPALHGLMENRDDWSVAEGELLEGFHFVDAVLSKKPSESDQEETSADERSRSVAVLCVPASAFCFGTSHPKGPLALKLRHLRILGHLPLLVPEQEILPLSEEQRIHFLREQIFPRDPQNISASTPEET